MTYYILPIDRNAAEVHEEEIAHKVSRFEAEIALRTGKGKFSPQIYRQALDTMDHEFERVTESYNHRVMGARLLVSLLTLAFVACLIGELLGGR